MTEPKKIAKDYVNTWYAPIKTSIVCPVPGCGHTTDYLITKAHCRVHHDMDREEIRKLYGMPKIIRRGGFDGTR